MAVVSPNTKTKRLRIASELSLVLDSQRQLLELKPITFEVDAHWTNSDASTTSSTKEEILKKVNELVTSSLKSKVETEIIPVIAWQLSTGLRETLPMFQDAHGKMGKIIKLQIERDELILHYSIPN